MSADHHHTCAYWSGDPDRCTCPAAPAVSGPESPTPLDVGERTLSSVHEQHDEGKTMKNQTLEPEPTPSGSVVPFAVTVCRRLCPEWARFMAARFNAPVRLIGSSLYSPTPRDVDIRIVLSDHEFFGRYGIVVPEKPASFTASLSQAWIDDMAKMNRVLCTTHSLNSDVQVWPSAEWRESADHRGAVIVLAQPSPRWHHPTAEQFHAFTGVRDE